MCMRLPFIPWSIAGVSLSQALLGRLITAPPSVSSLSDHDHCGGTLPPRSWARGGETYHWCATAPTLFVFVLAAACTMLCQDLTPGLAPTHHPCVQPHFTPTSSPPTPLHLIAISILAISCLSSTCRRASSLQPLRTEIPSTSTQPTPLPPTNTQPPHASAKYTQKPWLYPPVPLTKKCSSVARAQAPHRLASRWCPFPIPSSNGLGCIVSMYV